jgi:hypothetical protein
MAYAVGPSRCPKGRGPSVAEWGAPQRPLGAYLARPDARAARFLVGLECLLEHDLCQRRVRDAVAVGKAASDIIGGMGIVTNEAFFRLRAAEQLVDEGRRAEADEQLRRALAFYRSVGATRYVREGEALLAASA